MKRSAELGKRGECAGTQFSDGAQQPGGEFQTFRFVVMLFQQQIAEPLFKAVDRLESGVLSQVPGQPAVLLGAEVMAMSSHQPQQPAMFRSDRIQISPTAQEVVIDEPDHVEPICDDQRIGKVFAHDRAIDRRQVHTDDANQTLSF